MFFLSDECFSNTNFGNSSDNSTEKKCFSKKLTLIRLLNNNNYMLIKKNAKLGELQIPKKLYI